MASAISVKRNRPGLSIAIFEKLQRVGKKISVTGNGRCNITNLNITPDNYYSDDLDNAFKILNSFSYTDTKDFFSSIGVELITEGNKVYPRSFQASSVVDALRFSLESLNIPIFTENKITNIKKASKEFNIMTDKATYKAKSVLIATGGMAGGSKLGSDGDGYRLLKCFGHKILEQNPVICQVKTENNITKALKGIKINAEITVKEKGRAIAKDYGEVLF